MAFGHTSGLNEDGKEDRSVLNASRKISAKMEIFMQ